MKKAYCFSLLLLISAGSVVYAEQPSATDNTSWSEGQIVAGTDYTHDNPNFNHHVYRVFIKKTEEGYWVQEFYKSSNKKNTDPFLLQEAEDVTNIPYFYYRELVSPIKITGLYQNWYENGQMQMKGEYVAGKKHGLWSRWYENGQLQATGIYKNGDLDGLWRMWFENGTKMNEVYFKNNKAEGVLYELNDKQEKASGYESSFKSSPKIEKNMWLEWDENGYLKSQVMLVNGKKEGIWISWIVLDGKRSKEMQGNYKNDKRDGMWRNFWLDDSETVKSKGTYKAGRKDGLWTFWNQEGQKEREEFYEQGRLKWKN